MIINNKTITILISIENKYFMLRGRNQKTFIDPINANKNIENMDQINNNKLIYFFFDIKKEFESINNNSNQWSKHFANWGFVKYKMYKKHI